MTDHKYSLNYATWTSLSNWSYRDQQGPFMMRTMRLFPWKPPTTLSTTSAVSILCFIRDAIWILILFIPTLIASTLRQVLPRRRKDLTDKVVLITGAGNGLGRELALQFAAFKTFVICVDIQEKESEETVKQILAEGGAGKSYYCDVSNSEMVKRLAEMVWNDVGSVHILVNNAGIIFRNGMLDAEDEDIVKIVQVNFMSNLWMTRSFLPDMINKEEGHIVCISSLAGIHSLAHGNVYSSTKFALLGMAYSMIEELRSTDVYKNIKLSCVLPYFINTNARYAYFWRVRLPALSKEHAASLIIDGIRQEFTIFTVPGMEFGYYLSTVLRLLPNHLYHSIRDLFYGDFTEPEVDVCTKL